MNKIKNFIARMLGLNTNVYVVTAHDGEVDKTREIRVFADYEAADAAYHNLCSIYKRDSVTVTLASRPVQLPEPTVFAFTFRHSDGAGRTFMARAGSRAAIRLSVERARESSLGVSATADWTDTEELRAAAFVGPAIVGIGLRGALAYAVAKAIGRPIDTTGSAESTARQFVN